MPSALPWLRHWCFPCWRILVGFQLAFLLLDTCSPDILVGCPQGSITTHASSVFTPAPKPLSRAYNASNPVELLSWALKTFLLSPNLTFGTYLQSYWHKTYILDHLIILQRFTTFPQAWEHSAELWGDLWPLMVISLRMGLYTSLISPSNIAVQCGSAPKRPQFPLLHGVLWQEPCSVRAWRTEGCPWCGGTGEGTLKSEWRTESGG